MWRLFFPALAAGLLLSGCKSVSPTGEPVADTLAGQGAWQESILPQDIITRINTANRDYQRCLELETAKQAAALADPRAIGDGILRACEDRLQIVKKILDDQGVPKVQSERYLRKNRSQGAQQVMRIVQFVQAQRAAEQDEARQTPRP